MKESKHSLEKLWCKQGLVWVFLKPGRRLWNFQHTRQWQNQRRRKPIVRNGVQGYSKVPDEVEVWDDGELCQYIYSEVTSSHTTCRVPGYVYHLSFCCHRNIALNFHGKKLDISSECSTMVYEPMLCSCHALYSLCWSAYWQWMREQCMTSLSLFEKIYTVLLQTTYW